MLISKTTTLKWNSKNKKYYEFKGYKYTKMRDEFKVKIEDLSSGSNAIVEIKCDYCKTNIMKQTYKLYCKRHNTINSKDCCKECIPTKMMDTMMSKYGVKNISQSLDIKKKKEITCINNYGVSHPNKNQEICNKAIKKAMQTMYENGKTPSGKQQRYICDLLQGKLNYHISRCWLDIAFIEEMLYIEYDGGGHNLSVIKGSITQEEFDIKEIKRKRYLQGLGWKLIRIISSCDLIPQDNDIINLIKNAKQYLLNSNHSWYEINIDKLEIRCSEYIKNIELSNLRKIK